MEDRAWSQQVVDRYYSVRKLLAVGGMSQILEAEHTLSGRKVVLKVLPAERLHNAECVGRLLREARLLERARGPGVVELVSAGECPTFGPYLVMEHLVGRPFDGILAARGKLSEPEARPLFASIARTMARLHDLGVVHRDLKPSNFYVSFGDTGARECRVLDFGVSTWLDAPETQHAKLTGEGELLGTVEYMAPEQLVARHKLVDARADCFSFGASLFEALTGRLPFGDTANERIENFSTRREAPRLDALGLGVSAELSSLVAELLQFLPTDRTVTMRDAAAILSFHRSGAQEPAVAPPASAALPRGAEQRKAVRAPYVTPVRVLLGDRVLDGRSEDISEGGLLVMLKEPLALGATPQLRFALPMEGRVVTVDTVVRWAREGHGRQAVGLEWTAPNTVLRESVRAYVLLMDSPRGPQS